MADLHDINSLHARLIGAIGARLALAQAATEGPWQVLVRSTGIRSSDPYTFLRRPDSAIIAERHNGGTITDMNHIAANDPAHIIRHCQRDLKVLQRHRPISVSSNDTQRPICAAEWGDGDGYVMWIDECPEIVDLAQAYKIPTQH
jgi:hypothetical protein